MIIGDGGKKESALFSKALLFSFSISICFNLYFLLQSNEIQNHRENNNLLSFTEFTSNYQEWVNNFKKFKNESTLNAHKNSTNITIFDHDKIFRVLHVVTSLAEYEDGGRGTTRKDDRLQKIIIPALVETTTSIITNQPNWEVDVYLVLGYNISKYPKRKQMIRDALPEGVGLEIWDRAIPYFREMDGQTPRSYINEKLVKLARQHRYVVRDKIDEYDLFSCWEDDVVIKSHHMQNFLEMSEELNRLNQTRPFKRPRNFQETFYSATFGENIRWLVPGFMRVEVLKDSQKFPTVPLTSVSLAGNTTAITASPEITEKGIDSTICCNTTQSSSVALWETAIQGFSLHYFPNSTLDWIAFLPCRLRRFKSYWPFPDKISSGFEPTLFAQQAGWMFTKDQLLFIDSFCHILPYFEEPQWQHDAMFYRRHHVEFFSGGYDFFYRCAMGRVVSLDPKRFERQLIFHSSNNKQIQRPADRFVRANDLIGQLHTLKGWAMKKMKEASL